MPEGTPVSTRDSTPIVAADGTRAAQAAQPGLRHRADRPDPAARSGRVGHHPGAALRRRGVRRRAHQGRRFAQPAVPLRHQGVPAIRRGDQALSVQRVRRPGRGRGQEPDGAGVDREAPRSRHRPSADRQRARPDLAVLGAAAAGGGQAARRRCSRRRCRPAPHTTRWSSACSATRSSAASFCRRTARWRWSCSRSIPRSSAARASTTTVGEIRKTMQDDLAGTGLTVQLSGVPTMQLEIRNAVERDSCSTTPSASPPAA